MKNLNNNPIWNYCHKMLEEIDANELLKKYLEKSNYQVQGYSERDCSYQNITFITKLKAKLISATLGYTREQDKNHQWVKFNFLLKAEPQGYLSSKKMEEDKKEIGEVTLIFNENLEFIEENWLIDVDSPFVLAQVAKDVHQTFSLI